MPEQRVKLNWPVARIRQLQALEELLNEVQQINNGNHCLQRIAWCIRAARTLTKLDLNKARPSFIQFLKSKAWEHGSDNRSE